MRPGRNCWRLARADHVAVIVDAADYFAAAKAAILKARHTVFLIGWDFDWRIGLERRDPMPGVPDDLGGFLTHVVDNRPDLRIFVLRWDLSFLKFPFRAAIPLKILDWMAGRRLDLRADHEHPMGACHHQKIVVIDDALAFCGGIDMTLHRWDTPAHADDEPYRVEAGGDVYGPWHDATTCVDGDAARTLGELARERWRRATGEEIPPAPPCIPSWPEELAPDFTDVDIAVARTQPAYGDAQPEVREIEALYLDAVAAARRSLYIETQYFASHRIVSAMIRRLAEPDGPEIVVINPKTSVGWLEEEAMGSARAVLLRDVRAADAHGRFRLYTPVTEGGADIYVHAKVVIVDDRLLRIGSSNVNNRSMGLDTECDLVVEAQPGTPDHDGVRVSIAAIRTRLLAEHLGVEREAVEAALDREGGSLVRAIDGLRRPHGRSLVPFEAPELNAAEEAMARSHLLDPDRPEAMSKVAAKAGLGTALAVGLVAGAAAAGLALRSKRQE
ncbi:phospholipase [Salinarimonas soli]|uniref:Phospholipase D n=2 Tax=Salinarimonas soli TaxID=1638099 RepID=A0A5B2VAT6_9HYPH|nr:phospholipase [Salinarimonas soli]